MLSKQLWHSDLAARPLIHILGRHRFENCSTTDLITDVKHLIYGPATWSEESSTTPALAGSTSSNSCRVNSATARIRLLVGGRYFVVDHGQGVKCWDATTEDYVLTYPARVTDYSVEILDEGRLVIFFLVIYYGNQ